ncbi:FliH/SctL family protein [Tepidimonas charontis]|uniref:Flagellar assembly protein FliH n=1 Tax=Tepidimonas charontis TaxID=2267262 RepID=A0A554XK74_9BURK|nr:flagellar assembly protein FliH [Tepidimonas charontis]TSE36219.1 Flagellar assembly protein FliH [Tepidimonas charontis]
MPSSNRGTHPYQRFIPREEVQAVSAWTFAPVGEAAPAPASEPEPPPITPEDVEAARAQAFAEGFEQGRQTGAQEMRDALTEPLRHQAEELAQRVAGILAQAQAELDAVQQALAQQVLLLACDVARQVVRRELTQPLSAVQAVVLEALTMLTDDARPAVLRLHPDDAERLQPALGEALQRQQVRLQADERVTPGGCVLQTRLGVVDGTLQRRWARAVANLGLDEPWQPAPASAWAGTAAYPSAPTHEADGATDTPPDPQEAAHG